MLAAAAVVLLRDHSATSAARERIDGRVEFSVFDSLTQEEDAAHFAAGLRDTLGHTFASNGIKSVAIPAVRETGAVATELLLRGNVDRAQDKFSISADLVRRPEGLVLWSIAMQGEPGEVDTLQKRFSSTVTRVLQCALDNRNLAKEDPSADLLAKFLQYCAVYAGQGQLSQLEGFANQIVDIAPQYAISHIDQAIAAAVLVGVPAVVMIMGKPEEEDERLRKLAIDSAKAARQIEPHNKRIEALADYALARLPALRMFDLNGRPIRGHKNDVSPFSESAALLEKSLAADPQWGQAHFDYAALLSRVGRIDESRTEFGRAAGLLPLVYEATVNHALLVAAFGNVLAGRQEVVSFGRRTGYAVNDDLFWLEYWYGDPKTAKTYVQTSHVAEFVLPGYTDGVPRCLDALLEARIKRVPLSRARFDAVCANSTPDMPPLFEAERGDVDAAYRELETWQGWYGSTWWASQALYLPHMRTVRADTRFMPFAAKIGLVDYWLDSGHWPDFCTREELPYDCKTAALATRANLAD